MNVGLRVATYNIHKCIGRDGRSDPSRIARVLTEIEAEVVAVQEVILDRAGKMIEMIEAETGLQAIDGSIFDCEAGRYGNAVLTRYPLTATRQHDLSVVGREPRSVIDVSLDVDGTSCRFFATHLGLSQRERRSQINRLSGLLSADESVSVLLGDLNIPWRSKAVAALTAIGFQHVAVPSFPTWPSPFAALDRIFARPPVLIRQCWRHNSPLARTASDHFPVLADLEIVPGVSP